MIDAQDSDGQADVKNPLHYVALTENDGSKPPHTPRRTSDTTEWARDVFSLTTSSGSKAAQMKQRDLNRTVIVLLFVLGFAAGLVNGVILLINGRLCALQASFAKQGGYFGQGFTAATSAAPLPGIGLLYFLLAMLTSVALAAAACNYGATHPPPHPTPLPPTHTPRFPTPLRRLQVWRQRGRRLRPARVQGTPGKRRKPPQGRPHAS